MTMISRRTSLNLLGTLPLVGMASARGRDQEAGLATAREKIRARYFPSVTVITHEGRKVRFYDDLIKDKIVTINFMYADCEGICPGITANLVKVQKALGDRIGRDIFMYSLTLKPEHDTPAVLKEYADMHGIKPGWSLVTGDPTDMELLRRKLGFVDPDPEIDKDKNEHIGNVRYGNEALQLWASCPGLASPQSIVASIGFVDWPKAIRK
jgi:protein SCO1/2